MPDRDGQQHARNEKDEEHKPEADAGAPRALPMRCAGLPAGSLQAHGVSDGLMVDDGDVIRIISARKADRGERADYATRRPT